MTWAPRGTEHHPQWLTQTRDDATISMSAAGEVLWLNPFRPELQLLFTELALEVGTLDDEEGVRFDDPFSLPIAFGDDAAPRMLHQRETGRSVSSNRQAAAWVRWRAGLGAGLVDEVVVQLYRPECRDRGIPIFSERQIAGSGR